MMHEQWACPQGSRDREGEKEKKEWKKRMSKRVELESNPSKRTRTQVNERRRRSRRSRPGRVATTSVDRYPIDRSLYPAFLILNLKSFFHNFPRPIISLYPCPCFLNDWRFPPSPFENPVNFVPKCETWKSYFHIRNLIFSRNMCIIKNKCQKNRKTHESRVKFVTLSHRFLSIYFSFFPIYHVMIFVTQFSVLWNIFLF